MASVVVVGGGLAGLACAWRLRRAGHDVEVLEREAEAGGRLRTVRRGDLVAGPGAGFATAGDRNLRALAASVGLEEVPLPDRASGESVLRAGALRPVDRTSPLRLLGSPLLSPGARLRLLRLLPVLLRHRRRLDPRHPERATAFDDRDMAAGLRPLIGDEAFDHLVAPWFAATFGGEAEELSLGLALLTLRQLGRGARRLAFAGGDGALCEALARQLPVRTGCDVRSVVTEGDGARIRYLRRGRPGAVTADAAVVAVPAPAVGELCPKLTPAERGFFETVGGVRGTVVHLLFDRVPPTLRGGVVFPRCEGLDHTGLAVDRATPGASPPGAGLAAAALTEAASDRLWDAPDAAVVERVLAELARTPLGPLRPSDSFVQRGPSLRPRFGTGALRRLAAFHRRLERSPRLAFAGDYLVGPTLEGAVTSGARAATEVSRALAGSPRGIEPTSGKALD